MAITKDVGYYVSQVNELVGSFPHGQRMYWDYLNFVRVEKIKGLLLTDAPLKQAMESAGNFNRTTFTRMFRRQEGISPLEYRSLHKSGTNELRQQKMEFFFLALP